MLLSNVIHLFPVQRDEDSTFLAGVTGLLPYPQEVSKAMVPGVLAPQGPFIAPASVLLASEKGALPPLPNQALPSYVQTSSSLPAGPTQNTATGSPQNDSTPDTNSSSPISMGSNATTVDGTSSDSLARPPSDYMAISNVSTTAAPRGGPSSPNVTSNQLPSNTSVAVPSAGEP